MSNLLKMLKNYKSLLLILIGLLMMGFSMNCQTNQDLPEEDKMLYGFVTKAGKNLGLTYGLSLSGIGGGAKKEGIWLMSLAFDKYGDSLTEQSARSLIINCTNDFLEMINNDKELRPFLKEHPFTVHNLDLAIYSFDRKGNTYADPFISTISLAKGEIGYFTLEKPNAFFPYKTEKYESFEEGVAILKGTKN